jgi:rhamnosyltransferase
VDRRVDKHRGVDGNGMRTTAIIVAYRPDVERLQALCSSLVASSVEVVVVDNTEDGTGGPVRLPAGCTLVTLNTNTGIAHAQNIGIAWAIERGANALLILDQDSVLDPGALSLMLCELDWGKPCVVAPRCVDEKDGTEIPSYSVTRFGLPVAVLSEGRKRPYEVDLVIASGSLVTAETFSLVGSMDEDFFIDLVDVEWCLRCRAKRVPVRIVPLAEMRHTIGLMAMKYGNWTVVVHSPERTYYKLRNTFLLYRKESVPFLLACCSLASGLLQAFGAVVASAERKEHLKFVLRGAWDGVVGVRGRFERDARSTLGRAEEGAE